MTGKTRNLGIRVEMPMPAKAQRDPVCSQRGESNTAKCVLSVKTRKSTM